jgi:SAM-dependent methyltransferase
MSLHGRVSSRRPTASRATLPRRQPAGDNRRAFTDADAAGLYDLENPWDGHRFRGDAFYDRLVMSAESVLDVGCGTGSMLHTARACGHRGRLVGLDPDEAAPGSRPAAKRHRVGARRGRASLLGPRIRTRDNGQPRVSVPH